jgi:TolB-like protein/Flp pilus assembly protein TadD
MSDASKAVFLSYASQDAEAAKRICDSLRQTGVEVWFDQSELVGGDAWDAKIRKQIADCALFVPLISAATQARREGYFRLEWRLAAQRTHMMSEQIAFLLPVVIDATRDAEADVPAEFKAVQWTRLLNGDTNDVFSARVKNLLSGEVAQSFSLPSDSRAESRRAARPNDRRRWRLTAIAAVAIVVAVSVWQTTRNSPAAATPKTAVLLSETQQLIGKAWVLLNKPEMERAELDAADALCKRATTLDDTAADAWATWTHVHTWFITFGLDSSARRRESARDCAARAIQLAPESFEARLAQAFYWLRGRGATSAATTLQAEGTLRELLRERPDEPRALYRLGFRLLWKQADTEGFELLERVAKNPAFTAVALTDIAWHLRGRGRLAEADAMTDRAMAAQPYWNNLGLKAMLALAWHGDLDLARDVLNRMPPTALQEDWGATLVAEIYRNRREPQKALSFLNAFPREWLRSNAYEGPKALLVGAARVQAKQTAAARADFVRALDLIEKQLTTEPNNARLLGLKAMSLHYLGQTAEAENALRLLREVGTPPIELRILIEPADVALKALEASYSSRRTAMTAAALRLDPTYDPLRDHPQFQALLAQAEADPQRNPHTKMALVPEPEAKSVVTKVDDKSVAVLAFANLSDDKANEYFSDGISEELLNVLAKVPGLRVAARTSAFYFKGRNATAQEIGQKLSVAHLVEGSVRSAGTKVRIAARLSKAETGEQLWSENYERELKDIFALQDEIAGLIAKQLSLKLAMSSTARHEVNPEAHRLILEGRHFWRLRTDDGFARAEIDFSKAVDLDPRWAPAHAALADLWAIRALYRLLDGAPFEENLGRARAAAARALELDPDAAEPHAALGMVGTIEGRVAEAHLHFDRALALAPNHAGAHDWLGDLEQSTGRLDRALQQYRTAAQLDPLSPSILSDLGRTLPLARRFAEALEMVDRAEALQPGRVRLGAWRADVLLQLGRPQEAGVALQALLPKLRSGREDGGEVGWLVVHVLRALGRDVEAREVGAALLQFVKEDRSHGILLRFALGEHEQALALIERAPNTVTIAQYLFWHSMFDAIREQPRFQQLLVKLGRADQYQVARETLARMLKEMPDTQTAKK